MSSEMVTGQIYRVGFTGRMENEIATVECLMVATSVDDAKTRFPWSIDLSDYKSYRLDYVAKEPGRVCIIKTKIERQSQEQADATIERPEGSQSVWQKLQMHDGRRWQVTAQTTCYAKSEKSAQKKLAERILGGSENVKCVAEEMAVASGFAAARDVSMFECATFVRG